YRWQVRLDRVKTEFRGLFGGGQQQQPRPRICPSCGSLVGINTSRCHVCGANLNFSMAAVSKKLGALTGSNAPVTTVLLILNFLMFAVTLMMVFQAGQGGGMSILWGIGGEPTIRLGMSIPLPYIVELSQWWRLVTAMFLHGGLLHIGMNMMALFQLGPIVEETYGSGRFLFLYTFTGAFGFLCSAYR